MSRRGRHAAWGSWADESAAQALEAKARTIRSDLEEAGAAGDVLDVVADRLLENHHLPGDVGRTIVCTGDTLVFDDLQEGRSAAPEAWSADLLPDLSGWLAGEDARQPFCLVVTDREGADVDFYSARRRSREHQTVEGETFHLTNMHAGGWSDRRYDETVQNIWKANAQEVAEAVRSGVRRNAASFVLLAGDERMRSEVAGALDGLTVDVVQTEAGGRGAGASQEALWAEVDRIVATYVADHETSVLDRLGAGQGQQGAVASGLDAVLDALVAGQVDTLVLDLEAAREYDVKATEHPGLSLPAAVGDASAPADRVLVAAACLTDAALVLLPRSVIGGTGVDAVLRWDS